MKHAIHEARVAVRDPVTGEYGTVVAMTGRAWFCVEDPEDGLSPNPSIFYVELDGWAPIMGVEVALGGKIRTDKETWFWIQSVQQWEGRGDRCRGVVMTSLPGPWIVKMNPEDVLVTDDAKATWFDKVVTSSGDLF